MTERLYYADSYQYSFDATVLEITSIGERQAILLDKSCFYPTSGGQPHDLGVLTYNGISIPIIDVAGNSGEAVSHFHNQSLADSGLAVGSQIKGEIEWSRRYDHMQQHSAQHLLSHTFLTCFGYETISVHFGATESTIDLESAAAQKQNLTAEQLADAEAYANDVVYRNIPIQAYFVDDAQLAQLPVRRPPKVSGMIRIVEVDRLDYSACGGTHCKQSGELGPIKIVKQEKQKGHVRLTFLAGKRALLDYQRKHRIGHQIAGILSNELDQTPELLTSLLEQNRTYSKRIGQLNQQLLSFHAAEIQQQAEQMGDWKVVSQIVTDYSVEDAKQLASMLQKYEGTIALLALPSGEKCTLIFAGSEEISLHMGNLLKETLAEFGGGGGGRADFAQGGGTSSTNAAPMLKFALARVRAQVCG
ncbi:MAG: DHHA1 domain-containing protein [Chloroflexota bacterium]